MNNYLIISLFLFFILIINSCVEDPIEDENPPDLISQIERSWSLQFSEYYSDLLFSSNSTASSDGKLVFSGDRYELDLDIEFQNVEIDSATTSSILPFKRTESGRFEITSENFTSQFGSTFEYEGRIRFYPDSGNPWTINYFYSDIWASGDQIKFEWFEHPGGKILIWFVAGNLR